MTLTFRRAVPAFGLACALMAGAASRADAGTVCDLRTAGSTCPGINGGLFFTDEQHPTGTGAINSFVRIQQNSWEQGYNTSARPLQPGINDKTDPNFTRDLMLGEVGTKDIAIGAVTKTYREFFLDINEDKGQNDEWLTLDQLEVFVSNTASLNNYSATNSNDASGSLAGATKIYDMDLANSDNQVQLNYTLSGGGSGSSDMTFYLDSSLFGNYQYVYLFSQFGDRDCVPPAHGNGPMNCSGTNNLFESDAGFEEWFTKAGDPPVMTAMPEPASLLLLASGLALVAGRRLRRRRAVE